MGTLEQPFPVRLQPHCSLFQQGRSGRDGTLQRAQRRSFTPASFLEEELTTDFPEELDTSFFARVSGRQAGLPRGPDSG